MDQLLETLRNIFGVYGINLGIFTIRYYGIILMVGALAGALLAEWFARRRGMDPEKVWDLFLWVLIGGVIGARVWHIFTPPASMVAAGMDTYFYLTHPFDAANITKGGLGIPGAIIGGTLALYWFARRNRVSFAPWADIAVPALALGQAIGRWGNFVNNELYGKPSDLPWAISIPSWARLPGYEQVERYHPLFLYESILDFLNLGILLFLGLRFREKMDPGDLVLVYMLNYGIIRFGLEFLRLDPSPVAGLDINQALAFVAALVGGGMLLWRHVLKSRFARPKPAIVE
jgi:phosphatidylglycerol---prolipoprotein diacylglyceryl transferase